MGKPKYADLGEISEDERINLIGHRVVDHHEQVGVVVEDDAKADRYVAKLTARFPGVAVLRRGPFEKDSIVIVLVPAERVN